jgi:hypothetical protein
MSNNRDINTDWEDDDDDTDFSPTSFDSDTDLVKKLRKANRIQEKKIKDLETNLGSLTKTQRERIIKDTFAQKGVNAKIAAFVPVDLEASEDAISGWLEEYGDVFGVQTPQKTELSQQDIASLRQMDSVTNNAISPDRAEDIFMRIENATSAEELNSIIYSQQ